MTIFRRRGLILVTGIIVAAALLIAGGFLEGEVSAVLIGLGAALFGLTVANCISFVAERKYPHLKRTKNIEVNDERNITIREKAGAKTNTLVMWVMFIVMLIMLILKVELYVILAMSGIVLLNGILNLVYTNYYSKRL